MFPKTLRLEILAALAFKAVLLTLLYFAVIAPGTQHRPDAPLMRDHLLGAPTR